MRRQPSKHFLRRVKKDSAYQHLPLAEPSSSAIITSNNSELVVPVKSHFKRFLRFIVVSVELAAAAFVIPTALVLIMDLEDRQKQQTAQAWELLTNNAPGNSGMVPALEYLNSRDCEKPDTESKWALVKACGLKALFVKPKYQEPLTGIDLSADTHSSEVYLQDVQLSGANLWYANLSGANLRYANLSGTDLGDANLSGTDLGDANLSGTDLGDADLSGTDLGHADLSGTDLGHAILSGADLSRTRLPFRPPFKSLFTRGILMGEAYDAFPWPPNEQSGAFYSEGRSPFTDPALLLHFTLVGRGECVWLKGFSFYECKRRNPF